MNLAQMREWVQTYLPADYKATIGGGGICVEVRAGLAVELRRCPSTLGTKPITHVAGDDLWLIREHVGGAVYAQIVVTENRAARLTAACVTKMLGPRKR